MKIIVSACLLGVPCRYDGKSKPNASVLALSDRYELIPACAEVLGGLPTPRIPSEIVGDRVINQAGIDVTSEYKLGAEAVLRLALENDCKIAILKSKSPSCGRDEIYDGTFSRTLRCGNGICTSLLLKNDIKVLNEREIDNL